MTLRIGFLVFPQVQLLDLTGPYDVFASLPDTEVYLIWKDLAPLASSSGLTLTPDTTFETCPQLDVLCVPGGSGVQPLMEDEDTLTFLRRQAEQARYVTSVCTGALVLGAAGLLRGRRASTHWAFQELLIPLGAIPVDERVVRDGRLVTGGGVTAGIDFALALTAELIDEHAAQVVQLMLEYAPTPPYNAGRPETAPVAVVKQVRTLWADSLERRKQLVANVAAKLEGVA